MDQGTTKTTFTEYLNGLDFLTILREVDRLNLDRYIKKLLTSKFLKLMVYAQTRQVQTLTDLSLHLREELALQQEVGLSSISTAQLSRRLRSLNPDAFQAIFSHLASVIFSSSRPQQKRAHAKRLSIVDASTVTMCLEKFRWAEFRSTKAGIKLHQRLVFEDQQVVPEKAVLTYARSSDRSQMDLLVEVDSNALYLFDRGYVDYEKFDHYCESGTRFLTRMKRNARIREVEEERMVAPQSPVKRDAIVWLGQYPGYWMRSKLRLIEVQGVDGETVHLLTNDLEMDAQEIGALYRKRWQIGVSS